MVITKTPLTINCYHWKDITHTIVIPIDSLPLGLTFSSSSSVSDSSGVGGGVTDTGLRRCGVVGHERELDSGDAFSLIL